ncbi:MAG: DUF4136 domain-containing protein [Vicinamibacterales bacterium]
MSMARTLRTLVIGALLLWLPSVASGQDVETDWDRTYDFSKLRTFVMTLGTSWDNQLSEDRVMNDVGETLMEKGWVQASQGSADAIVVLHGTSQTRQSLNTFYDGWVGWGWGGPGGVTTTVTDYQVGTLVVDIFEAGTKKLLFRGTATSTLSKSPSKNAKKVQKAAEKMFKHFPPTPGA